MANALGQSKGPANARLRCAPNFFDEDRPSERLFQRVVMRGTSAAIAERIERETRFDPDVWVVEVEDKSGRSFLDLVEDKREPR